MRPTRTPTPAQRRWWCLPETGHLTRRVQRQAQFAEEQPLALRTERRRMRGLRPAPGSRLAVVPRAREGCEWDGAARARRPDRRRRTRLEGPVAVFEAARLFVSQRERSRVSSSVASATTACSRLRPTVRPARRSLQLVCARGRRGRHERQVLRLDGARRPRQALSRRPRSPTRPQWPARTPPSSPLDRAGRAKAKAKAGRWIARRRPRFATTPVGRRSRPRTPVDPASRAARWTATAADDSATRAPPPVAPSVVTVRQAGRDRAG